MKINRLFEIIYLLLDKKMMTANELSEYFEVSTRTIYRDIESLTESGIPIYMERGKGGGITLLPNFILNKAILTDDEKKNILSAMQTMDALKIGDENTTIRKISALFGGDNTNWLEVDFSNWGGSKIEEELFKSLKSMILARKVCSFIYTSPSSVTVREVEPLRLCFKGHAWYLYAYCKKREDFRFFKLARIKQIKGLKQSFIRSVPEKIFTKESEFKDDFMNIKLKVSKKLTYRVYDEFSEYEILPDGDFIVYIDIPKGHFVYYYISSFGEDAEVLEPEEVRLEMKERLEKTLKKYL